MVGYSSIHGVTYWLMTSYNWYFGPFHRNVRIQSLIHRSLICYTPLIPWTHVFDIHANGYDITNILGKQSNIIQQTHNWYTQPGWWFHPLWTNMSQLRSFFYKKCSKPPTRIPNIHFFEYHWYTQPNFNTNEIPSGKRLHNELERSTML